MEFWTEKTALTEPSVPQLRDALHSEEVSEGWIGQIEKFDKDYLHAMAFMKPTGEAGFYLERRGPEPDQWYMGITPGRPKHILPMPWWQFWAKDIEIYLFEHDEMVEAFCQVLSGVSQPDLAEWEEIPPSYED